MALGPAPYVPKGRGKRPYSPPASSIDDLIAAQQRAQAGQQFTMGRSPMAVGPASGQQMPLTRALPRVGPTDISHLYQKPGTLAQPLTRQLPRVGPNAGNVSNLTAPRMLNAAPSPIAMGPAPAAVEAMAGPNPYASRALRGGWTGGSVTPQMLNPSVPSAPRPMSIPGGVQNVNPFASAMSGPPNPPASPSMSLTQQLRSLPGNLTGSFVPGWKGLKGYGANMAVSAGLGAAANAVSGSDFGQNTADGRTLSAALRGGAGGSIFGPKLAAASAATLGSLQQGQERRSRIEEKGFLEGFAPSKPDSIGGIFRSGVDAVTLPLTAPLEAVGALTGGADWVSDVPLVGGLFGGGGEEESAAAPQQSPDELNAELSARYNPDTLTATMSEMGISPGMQQAVLSAYQQEVAWAKAGDRLAPDPSVGYTQDPETGDYLLDGKVVKPSDMKTIELSDAQIEAQAWDKAYQGLPALYQQQTSEEDFFRRQAAMQAALVAEIPTYTQPFYEAGADGYGSVGELVAGAPGGQGLLDSYGAGMGRMGDAYARSFASIPANLAMEQRAAEANSISSQIQNAMMQQQLAAQFPSLFGQQESSGSAVDAALAEAIANGLG